MNEGTINRKYRHVFKNAGWCLLALLPWLTLLILSIASGHNCLDGRPFWSDEVDYWREIYSFSNASDGWFGYNGFDGYPAKIGTWGCHGISPLLAYGLWSVIFGWTPSSIVICNAVMCSAAFAIFCFLARPSTVSTICIALVWLLYPPILQYAPSSMMEMPQYAGIIVYLGVVARMWKAERPSWLIIAFAWVVFMAGLRVSNVVFFIPLVLIGSNFRVCKRFWVLFAVAFVLFAASYLFFGVFNSGYPGGFLSSLADLGGAEAKASALATHAINNIQAFFARGEGLPQVSQRYAYFAVFVTCTAYAAWGHVKLGAEDQALAKAAATSAFTLGALWLIVVFAYDVFDWRDYRTLAPVLFAALVALCLAASGKRGVFLRAGCVAFCALLLVGGWSAFPTSSAFEAGRYEKPAEAPQSLSEADIAPMGDEPQDRTIVLLDGWQPEWLWYGMPPEMGIVASTSSAGIPYSDAAYVGFPANKEAPSGYETVWQGEDGAIAKRA